MNRLTIWMAVCGLALPLACGRDKTDDAAGDATSSVKEMAEDTARAAQEAASSASAAAADKATAAADVAADKATAASDAVAGMAGAAASDAVATCRSLAEQGAWESALEVCKKAHEMLPDDLAITHAYQQATAAAE